MACNQIWQDIIGYIANVQAESAALSTKAEALRFSISQAIDTPGLITDDFLKEVREAQENIEKDIKVNINIEEKLLEAVVNATAAFLKEHPYKE